jgi:4-amino-4-deoxy-L-arabinose transferase
LNDDVSHSEGEFWKNLLLVLLTGLAAVLLFNGSRPLMDSSEARYAEVAREMAYDGHWLVPHLAGQPHLTKPPLAYWIVALPLRFFGRSEAVARLSGALFTVLMLVLVALVAKYIFADGRIGIAAAWVQLVSVFPFGASNTITTDVFLSVFETLIVLCFWGIIRSGDEKHRCRWRFAFYLAIGAAFFTKGPPGLLVLIPVLVYRYWQRANLTQVKLFSLTGILIVIVMNAWWFIAVAVMIPHAFRIWRNEAILNVLESSDRDMNRFAYFAILILGSLPGSLILIRRFRSRKPLIAEEWFLLLWIILPLCAFLLSKTRLSLYVLPLFPPISIFAGREWIALLDSRSQSERRKSKLKLAAATGAFVIALVLAKHAAAEILPAMRAHDNFKPIAATIQKDVERLHSKPELIITMIHEGHGILYYLNGPPAHRVSLDVARRGKRTEYVLAELLKPPLENHIEYIVTDDSRAAKYESALEPGINRVETFSKWVVYRRDTRNPVRLKPDYGRRAK